MGGSADPGRGAWVTLSCVYHSWEIGGQSHMQDAEGTNAFIYQAGDMDTQVGWGEREGLEPSSPNSWLLPCPVSSLVWCSDPIFVSVSDHRADHAR